MAEKLLKVTKRKIVPKNGANGSVSTKPPQEIVLVGTYKEKQLAWIRKNGVYNYPAKDGDEFDAETFGKIKEIWLYADAKGSRHCFESEFVGKMTREEFVAAYPTYAKIGRAGTTKPPQDKISVLAKSENREYYVFKTALLDYGPKLEGADVIVRAADFATGYAKKVKKAVDAYHADGDFGSLADYLPTELSEVPRERLMVCEAAVQMDFWGEMNIAIEAPAKRNSAKATAVQAAPKRLCKSIADYSKITVKAFGQRNLFTEVKKETAADDIRVVELFAGVGGFRIGLERKAA